MIWWLLTRLAAAQVIDTDELSLCAPYVFQGTPQVAAAQQATSTNAQVYGAVAFAEGLLLPDYSFPVAFQQSIITNVARVPTMAACPLGDRYGMAALDLYTSASGIVVPIRLGDDGGELKLFYAGSISGTLMHFPSQDFANNRVFSGELLGLAGIGLVYAPPLAAFLADRQTGPQSLAGDAIVGAQLINPWDPELGAMTLGYVYSSGLYTNVTVAKLKVLASALLTSKFSELAMAKLGMSGLIISEALGRSHAYYRRKLLEPPPPNPDALIPALPTAVPRVDLHTVHVGQMDLGGWIDLRAALAVLPEPMLHEGALAVHDPDRIFSVELGTTQLPAMPWYGVEGGPSFYYEISAAWGVLQLSRNDAETLTNFPYAHGAVRFQLGVDEQLLRMLAEKGVLR